METIISLIVGIAALISAAGAVIGTILSSRKIIALMEYRLGQVEQKLDAHNGYAEKFAETSVTIAQIQKDIEYLRINSEKA